MGKQCKGQVQVPNLHTKINGLGQHVSKGLVKVLKPLIIQRVIGSGVDLLYPHSALDLLH